MKQLEKIKAIELRKLGYPINKIYKEVGASKGRVSEWVRHIELTEEQKKVLKARYNNQTLGAQAVSKKYRIIREHHFDIGYNLAKENDSFRILASLYWGEGSKNPKGLFSISNSDPEMIKLVIRYCLQFADKLPCYDVYVYLNNGLLASDVESYWKSYLEIDSLIKIREQKISRASQQKCVGKLPYGTFRVNVNSVRFLNKVLGGISYLKSLGA